MVVISLYLHVCGKYFGTLGIASQSRLVKLIQEFEGVFDVRRKLSIARFLLKAMRY